MAEDPNESIWLFDLSPDSGGAPARIQATRGYAFEMVEALPSRYRIQQTGDVLPVERADGKPIILLPDADQ